MYFVFTLNEKANDSDILAEEVITRFALRLAVIFKTQFEDKTEVLL